MNEIRREIPGYKGLYEITESGKIISLRQQRPIARCNDEYGFHIVKLTNHKGEKKNHNVYDLWNKIFENADKRKFKGALKPKYGIACKILRSGDVHFN
ncbi:NUMOD4 domain-containing protein [Virgibacillus sp. SK37]|uniref:NUMOD4 domain-containing protein n=1 Tax=Virgibacillus sp. SK37 TaxID=403957 RepID=UPI0004D1ABD5|nr:NUMOD4 domain-containing protein [Virgibacillus sp. SK37]AIF44519.1 3-ketosteroid-delta-1-dehydrogenase [Virgibacillus sp. SK37]